MDVGRSNLKLVEPSSPNSCVAIGCFSRLLAETLGTYSLHEISRPEDVIEQDRVLWRTVLQQCHADRTLVSPALRDASAVQRW
jgi:hypothetical protein